MKFCFSIPFFLFLPLLFGGCSSDSSSYLVFNGELNKEYVGTLTGFGEQKTQLLEKFATSEQEFIGLSTAPAAELSAAKQAKLRAIRNDLSMPNTQTLLQQVIALSEIPTYMENVYDGKIGGFISVAADMKGVHSMKDVYWGLRLDYPGTPFKENGAGYGVIRFYTYYIDSIAIPFSPELGGETIEPWPFTGGGFTASTLGTGGYPEYIFKEGYYAPAEGAELYECTPNGNEILRSIFRGGRWSTHEGEVVTTRTPSASGVNGRYVGYQGFRLYLRGETSEGVHLFTFDEAIATQLGMEVYAKGEYRLIVPASSIVEE
ncbi:MAG: hypothetical protein ACRCUJ_03635 [Phocaeicola sp.]